MKRAFLMLAAALLIGGVGGCHWALRDDCTTGHCTGCASGDCGQAPPALQGNTMAKLHGRRPPGMAGPPTGAVAYPYYTTRGPRDFLQNNPASIGP